MKFKDYYQVLGVEDSASQDEIKRAYRKLARKYHPDVSKEPDAEEQFKSVNEAYEVLRDEKRRAEFDQIKKYGFRGGDDFQRPPGWQGEWQFDPRDLGAGGSDFSDFFRSIFGEASGVGGSAQFDPEDLFGAGGHGRQYRTHRQHAPAGRHSKGNDIHLKVRLSLMNAYRGGKTKIKVPAASGYPEKTLSVNIPAGAVDGQQLRLRGQGRPGAVNGDLILTVLLKPHELFTVEGSTVVLTVPVTPLEAIQGTVVEVPTLGGKVSLKIPKGTQSGSRLRIKGKGLPSTPAGDQIAVVEIALPETLDEQSLKELRDMEARWQFDPRAHYKTALNVS